RRSNLGELVSETGDARPAVGLTLARMGDVCPPEVDADYVVAAGGRRNRLLDLDLQVVDAAPPADEGSTRRSLSLEQVALVAPDAQVEAPASVEQRQGYRPVPLAKAEYAGVVVGAGRTEV